jgi:uncharacterized RDD family membrane protein YckC/DNA-binding transcriptional ArsR family regulator
LPYIRQSTRSNITRAICWQRAYLWGLIREMAIDQENVSRILSALSNTIRREILLILHEKGETSFTELMTTLAIDTGKLSFHMRNLAPFVEQTSSGKYKLSRAGIDAVRVIKDVESFSELSALSPKTSNLPLSSFKKRTAAFLIDFGIMFSVATLLLLPTFFAVLEADWWIIFFNLLMVTLFFIWVYSTILEGFKGQTLGKRLIGLQAKRVDGKKLDYEHAAIRNLGKILLPFDLFFGFILHDLRYIRYFDKFAGTAVIDLRLKPIPASVEGATQNTS